VNTVGSLMKGGDETIQARDKKIGRRFFGGGEEAGLAKKLIQLEYCGKHNGIPTSSASMP